MAIGSSQARQEVELSGPHAIEGDPSQRQSLLRQPVEATARTLANTRFSLVPYRREKQT